MSSPRKPLTCYGAKDRCWQQGTNAAHHRNNSHAEAPRTGIVKSSSPQKQLTFWSAEERHRQQGQNEAHHGSHPLSGEPRTGIVIMVQMQLTTDDSPTRELRIDAVSRVQTQLTTEATHELEGQGQASSAGPKSSSPRKLTCWRAEDKRCQESTCGSPRKQLTG